MLNKVFALTKMFFKNSYQNPFSLSKATDPTKVKKKKVINIFIYIILFGYLAAVFGFLSYNIISLLISINQPAMFLGIFLLMVIILVLFQTIFSSINVFYFAKDIQHVLPFPIKPIELLMAKFNIILISEYITVFIFGLSPLILYGILTSAGPLFYLLALIVLLFFPILPAIIANFVIMILMTFTKFVKNKDRFQLITTIFVIIIAIVIQFSFNSNVEITDEMMIEQLSRFNGMVDSIQNYFITLEPAVNALANQLSFDTLINMLKLIGITIISYCIFIFIGSKVYLRGAVGGMATGKKYKKLNVQKAYKTSNKAVTYLKKELLILFRNPVYFIQCILPSLAMPILFLVILFVTSNQIQAEEGVNIIKLLNEINVIMIICGVLAFLQFIGMMSFIAITAISRDGNNAYFVKYIPVSLYKQFIYKIIPAVLLNIMPIVIVIGVLIYFVPKLWIYAIPIFIIGMVLNIIQSYLCFIVDLKRPKLQWDTEYAVVKQNMNMIFEFAISFVIIAILIGLMFGLQFINVWIGLAIIIIIFTSFLIVIDRYVYKNKNVLFSKIS